MFNILKSSFKITNNFIVIATPLILFSLFASIYLILSSGGNTLSLTITAILFFLMLGAFLSGWLYMIKKAVTNPEEESKDRLIFEFPSGVGEYFLTILGMVSIIILISILMTIITVLVGKKLIGDTGITYTQFSNALISIESMKTFMASLSTEQLSKLRNWNLLITLGILINHFIIMFYSPVVFFKEKNPFKAFFITLKDTFGRKFFKNIFLFFIIFVVYIFLSVLSAFMGRNLFLHFFSTLINFYYVTYVAILVFNYYYSNFAKIGSNIDATI